MQGVVDFVGHGRRQPAHGGHFLGLYDLGLFFFQLARALLDAALQIGRRLAQLAHQTRIFQKHGRLVGVNLGQLQRRLVKRMRAGLGKEGQHARYLTVGDQGNSQHGQHTLSDHDGVDTRIGASIIHKQGPAMTHHPPRHPFIEGKGDGVDLVRWDIVTDGHAIASGRFINHEEHAGIQRQSLGRFGHHQPQRAVKVEGRRDLAAGLMDSRQRTGPFPIVVQMIRFHSHSPTGVMHAGPAASIPIDTMNGASLTGGVSSTAQFPQP